MTHGGDGAVKTLTAGQDLQMTSTAEIQRFLLKVLDAMPVTDRAYRHLHRSLPLVGEIVRRVRRAAHPGEKVLLIGGSALLANALLETGYDLDIWQFPHAFMSEQTKARVRREIVLADLYQCEVPEGQYGLVIVPLVLDSLAGDAADFLRRLRQALTSDGTLIVATKNQSRLDVRLAAVLGKPLAMRQGAPAFSLSWPALPVVTEYHREDLMAAAQRAGFRVKGCQHVTADRNFFELEALPLASYALVKGRELLCALLPSARDTLLLELLPRRPATSPWKAGQQPSVSVIVSAVQGGEPLRALLAALRDQTYPPELLEVLVIHDGRRTDVIHAVQELRAQATFPVKEAQASPPDGPLARNLAMAQACGEVCGHTDDFCRVATDWVEGAVVFFDEDTAVVAGPIFASDDSNPSCLEVPGVRPEPTQGQGRRQDLFPISNVFYRTKVALSVGGFSQRFQGDGCEPSVGWDTELAWRLQRRGWQARSREEVCVFRRFPGPNGPWIREQFKEASQLPAFYAAVPEVAKGTVFSGAFASRNTMYFDLMLAGAALAVGRRRWPWLLSALPWLAFLSRSLDFWPHERWGYSLRLAAKMGVLHLVWLAGLLKGSINSRRLAL